MSYEKYKILESKKPQSAEYQHFEAKGIIADWF